MPTPTPADAALARDLEPLIGALTSAHERMLALALEHRTAISRADTAAIAGLVAQQSEVAREISELEIHRRRLVAPFLSATAAPPSLSALAQRLPEPDRARVAAAAAHLRETLLRLQRETRTVRAATQSLLAHMNGLMQQVARGLSQARLYSPQGKIDPGLPVACGLDLTH